MHRELGFTRYWTDYELVINGRTYKLLLVRRSMENSDICGDEGS